MKTMLLTAVLGLCFLNFKTQAQLSDLVTNGLIAYYPLNGNAFDQSGNGNNGTVFGATLTSDRFGNPGMAYQFNGTNDYISANVSNLPTGSAARTVSLWAKSNPPKVNGEELLWWGTALNDQAFQVFNNGIDWHAGGYGGGDDLDSGVLVDTNWHSLIVSYDGSTMAMSIDGIQRQSQSLVMSTPFSTVNIGSTMGGGPAFFSGAINEVRIYNRVLSSNDVSELYQSFAMGILTFPAITISGSTNQNYSVQYVTNLHSSNWTTLVSNIVLQSSTNTYCYPDTNAVGQAQRFYRVVFSLP